MRTDLPFPLTSALSRREFFLCTLFALTCLIIGFCSVALPAIGGSSEAREAHVIRLMVEQNDFVLPLRNGIIPSKPPLFHWWGVGFSALFGRFAPLTARLPSLFAAAIILWVIAALASELGGRDAHKRGRLIVWAGIILSTSYEFEKMRTVAMVDMVFSLCVTLALAPLIYRLLHTRAVQGGVGSSIGESVDYTAFFIFSGLAVLAKGPIGIVLPVLLILPVLATGPRGLRGAIFELARPRIGWVMFLLLALPWYVLAALRQSQAFLGKQLLFENLNRFTGGENVNQQPWWFYLPAFLRAALPWSLIFLAGGRIWFGRAVPTTGPIRQFPVELMRAFYLLVALGVVFFSSASGKRDSYLLPLIPWMAVATAPLVINWLDSLSARVGSLIDRSLPQLVVMLSWGFLLVLALFEVAYRCAWVPRDALMSMMQLWVSADLPVVGIVAAGAVFLVPLTRRLEMAREFEVAARALTLLSIVSICLALGVSVRNRLKNFEAVAFQVNQQIGDRPLQVVRELRDEFFDGVLYYLKREVQLVSPASFAQECQGYALVRYDQWQTFKEDKLLAAARIVAVYGEIDDQLKGRTNNQKVLLECTNEGERRVL